MRHMRRSSDAFPRFMAPVILAFLFVINLMTSPGDWWVQWAALGLGIAWVISLFRVMRDRGAARRPGRPRRLHEPPQVRALDAVLRPPVGELLADRSSLVSPSSCLRRPAQLADARPGRRAPSASRCRPSSSGAGGWCSTPSARARSMNQSIAEQSNAAGAAEAVGARDAREQLQVHLLRQPPERAVADVAGLVEHARLQVVRDEADDLAAHVEAVDACGRSADRAARSVGATPASS